MLLCRARFTGMTLGEEREYVFGRGGFTMETLREDRGAWYTGETDGDGGLAEDTVGGLKFTRFFLAES